MKRISKAGVTTATVRRLAFTLPGVEDGKSFGFPALKVGKKFLARLRDEDAVLVVKLGSFADRDYLLSDDPSAFFTTDHYRDYPTVLIRLARVREPVLREILTDAWRRIAPRRLVAQLDAAKSTRPAAAR